MIDRKFICKVVRRTAADVHEYSVSNTEIL